MYILDINDVVFMLFSGTVDHCFETKDEKKSKKHKLLEKAPVLPYDIDLYHWEDEKPVLPERIK